MRHDYRSRRIACMAESLICWYEERWRRAEYAEVEIEGAEEGELSAGEEERDIAEVARGSTLILATSEGFVGGS